MDKFKRIAAGALYCLLCMTMLSSCYTTHYYIKQLEEDYNNTYKYCNKEFIIKEHGTPDRITATNDGGEVIIYEKNARHAATAAEGDDDRQYLEFYMGSDSRCKEVKTNYTETISKKLKSKPTRKGIIWGIAGGSILLIEGVVFLLLL